MLIEAEEKKSREMIYTDEKRGIQIQIPAGWNCMKNYNNMELLLYRENQELQSNVNFMILPNKNHVKMEQILRRTKIEVKQSVQDFELYELNCVDDNHGRFACSGIRENRRYRFRQEIYLAGRCIYCFTACCPESEKEIMHEELEQIMDSIQVSR